MNVSLPPSLEQREVTLSTGGGSADMLIMPDAGVHVAQIMARSSHLALCCWCALVTKSTRHKQARAALRGSVDFSDPWWPLTSASLHSAWLFDIQVQRKPGLTSENIVLLCLEVSSALTSPSPGRAPRPSEKLHLTDQRPLTVVMKHHLRQKKLFQTPLTLKYRIY